MKFFILYIGFKMNSIYISILKGIAPSIVSLLKDEAKKSTNTIDDKLVTILEKILIEFQIIGK